MENRLPMLALAFAISVSLQCGANAAPVTAADLSGKKICWATGSIATYSPGGRYSSTAAGSGTWEVTSIGVQLKTDRFNSLLTMEKDADGSFKTSFTNKKGLVIETIGKVCN
jgi:hypothetical protein